MHKARAALLVLGIPGLLAYGTVVAAQWRAAGALADFKRLQDEYPPDSLKPVAAPVLEQKTAALARAARLAPWNPEAHFQSGILKLVLAEGNSLSPEDAPAAIGTGPEPKLARPLQEGFAAVQRAIRLNPGVAEYHFVAALYLQNLAGAGGTDAESRSADKAVGARLENSDRLDPYKPSLHFRIGSFQMARGNTQEARRAFAVALTDSYHYAQPVFGVLWSSVDDMQELGNLVGDEPLARALLADFLWDHGYQKDAEREYGIARSHRPIDFRTGELLIEHAFRTKDYSGVRDVVSVLEKDKGQWSSSQFARLKYFQGQSFFQEGRYQDSIDSLEAALNIDQSVYYIHEALGNAYAQAGDYDRAIARYQLALNRSGDVLPRAQAAKLRVELALVYERKNRFIDALGEYFKATKLDPTNDVAQKKTVELSREHL